MMVDWGQATMEPIWPPRMFTSLEETVRFIDELCRQGNGQHDWNVSTQHCRRCGISAEMLDGINSVPS